MELVDYNYVIQKIPVEDICREFGTPLYVYDADKIISQLKSLRSRRSGKVRSKSAHKRIGIKTSQEARCRHRRRLD